MTQTLKRDAGVPVVWRERAFDGAVRHRMLARSARMPTVAEIVAETEGLPRLFASFGEVRINGDLIPRGIWHLVRPRFIPGRDTVVSLHVPLGKGGGSSSSGGGGGGKNPIATIASIAILLVAAAVSGGVLAGVLGPLFAAGTIGAAVAGAAIGIGGALAIAALVPPPSLSNPLAAASGASPITGPTTAGSNNPSAASLTGNVLSPGAAMPRVVGSMRVFPPLLCNPLIEVVGDVEVGEAVFGLCGPHDLTDVRVGDTATDSIADVQTQLSEGKPGDAIQTLVTRQSFTLNAGAELVGHVLNATTQSQLLDQSNPGADVPQAQPFTSRNAPDEIWINLQWPEGLFNETDTTIVVNQAFRVQIRRRGDPGWINLPEVHFSMNKPGGFQKVIRVKWDTFPLFANTPPTNQGPVYAYKTVPGQNGSTVSPSTIGWTADSSFSKGAGNDLLSNATFAGSNVKNVELYQDKVIFYLDPAVFPQDFYEIQVARSHAYPNTSLTAATYAWSDTNIYDFFFYFLSGGIAQIITDQKPYHSTTVVSRISSIWNENPVQSDDFATVSIRVQSRALDALSVLASGLVPDWDGAAWSGLNATSNPAPHFRDVLAGSLGGSPVPASLIDDAALVDWRSNCNSLGYTANAVVEGKSYNDALLAIAGTGYARFRHNETYGVFQDRDRSADAPIQVFTPRNMTNFQWTRAFANLPTGIRANYVDADNNYDTSAEIIVYDNPAVQDADGLSQVSYDGLVHQSDVEARARFDLDQAKLRFTFYQGDCDAEALVCQRGDLVAVQHDILAKQAGFSRILDVSRSAGNVVGLNLDGTVPINTTPGLFALTGMFQIDHLFLAGQKTGMAIRLKSGNGVLIKEVTAASNGDQTAITFVSPFADPGSSLDSDCMIAVGPLASEYKRLLVFGVQPSTDTTATLTFIDEAPSLFPVS